MGVGLNTMLAAIGAGGVAASKIGAAADQQANDVKAKKEKEKRDAIDKVNMEADLALAENDADYLSKKQEANQAEIDDNQAIVDRYKGGKKKKAALDNLQALSLAKDSLDREAAANEIRMNQIKEIMKLKGYGGKK